MDDWESAALERELHLPPFDLLNLRKHHLSSLHKAIAASQVFMAAEQTSVPFIEMPSDLLGRFHRAFRQPIAATATRHRLLLLHFP